ncbi:MAG: heavy metal-binding domain-containing protein [Bdellovibrionota bacterium]
MIQEHRRVTGLSGNEIYCLSKQGMRPGQLCIGNSVVAIGFAGGIGAGLSTLGGGEVSEITNLVHEGRMNAFNRMMEEAKRYGGVGLTGVSFDLVSHGGNLEFITTGSTVHQAQDNGTIRFSTSADAQQLYCQIDSGFEPLHFVFGNVAYSIGLGGNLTGAFRKLVRGEVPQYSQIFDDTRHLALERLVAEAKKHGANSVVGIQTTISPLMGAQEMMMVGTASRHPALGAYADHPVTSDMTNEEMWNMANLGYLPLRLVMGVSVYSLGLKGGILSALQSIGGGEIRGLTELLYEAREKALARIERDAEECGADEVLGVKTRVYDLGGGLVEFMAIGTAVKKVSGVTTKTDALPPQAIIQDRETFVDATSGALNLQSSSTASARRLQSGPMAILGVVFVVIFYILKIFLR